MDFKTLGVFSSIITFCGFVLGYFLFNAIGLNYNTHLPLFSVYVFLCLHYIRKFRHRNCDVTIYQFFCNGFIDQQSRWSKEKFIPDHWSNFMVNFLFCLQLAYVYFRFDSLYFYFRSYFAEYFQIIFGNVLFWTYFGWCILLVIMILTKVIFPIRRRFFLARLLSIILFLPVALYVLYAVMDHFANFNKKVLRVNLSIRLCLCFLCTIGDCFSLHGQKLWIFTFIGFNWM